MDLAFHRKTAQRLQVPEKPALNLLKTAAFSSSKGYIKEGDTDEWNRNTLYTATAVWNPGNEWLWPDLPSFRLGGQTYMVDMQEMVVWAALNWRISKREDISLQCDKLVSSLGDCISRSWDACVNRLLTRGLLVSGCGETEYDALYDLLSSLGIIPASGSMLMRSISFVKLWQAAESLFNRR